MNLGPDRYVIIPSVEFPRHMDIVGEDGVLDRFAMYEGDDYEDAATEYVSDTLGWVVVGLVVEQDNVNV